MKPLATTFTRSGWTFKQLAREGRIAVYVKRQGSFHTWEVIKIAQKGECIFKGRHLEAREVYPPSESWGVKGWACQSKQRAYRKMDELLAAQKEKKP